MKFFTVTSQPLSKLDVDADPDPEPMLFGMPVREFCRFLGSDSGEEFRSESADPSSGAVVEAILSNYSLN